MKTSTGQVALRLGSVAVLMLLLVGCATTRYQAVQIISDPPGAKIEINNQYVGETPVTLTIPYVVDYSQNWNGNAYGSWNIVAYPTIAGQYVQRKFVTPPVPSTIYFNMGIGPALPTIKSEQDIRVRSENYNYSN